MPATPLGSDWSAVDCDGLSIKFVPLQLLQEEADLYATKHWDYRFLHPAQATQLYGEAYASALKRAVKRRTDIWKGLNMRGLKKDMIFELESRAVTGLWKGRQMADRIGCTYDFYCEQAMQFADIARMHFLPTVTGMYSTSVPAHLEGRDSMVEFIIGKWLERSATSIVWATHPAYLAENYADGPEQNLYLNYLFERIKASNHSTAALATALEKGLISEDLVMQVFPKTGADLIARAFRLLA